MRAVFLILLFANALFLAWAHWIDAPRDASAQDPTSRLPRLQLVTEAPPVPKPGAAAAEKMAYLAPAPAPVPDARMLCNSIGPYTDLSGATRAAALLSERGLHPQQRAEEGETIEGYWVFVSGFQSDDEVRHAIDRLGRSGFQDARVMGGSTAGRRISVGMFSSRDRAERRAAAVKQAGLAAEIGERRFQGTRYWLDVESAAGSPGALPEPASLLSAADHRKVSIQACPPEVQPLEPERSAPAEIEAGVKHSLPRTTVASAPKLIP